MGENMPDAASSVEAGDRRRPGQARAGAWKPKCRARVNLRP